MAGTTGPRVNSAGRGALGFARKLALGEIDGLATAFAVAGLVEFIRKNFNFLIAFGALAGERFQVFKIVETGAMQWCRHRVAAKQERGLT